MGAARRFSIGITTAFLILTLGLSPIGGGLVANLEILVMLASVFLARGHLATAWRDSSAPKLFAISFVMIAIAFIATATGLRDLRAIGNFLPLILLAPTIALLTKARIPKLAPTIATVALFGVLLAFLWGSFEVFVLRQPRAESQSNPILYADLSVVIGFIAAGGLLLRSRWQALYALGPLAGLGCALIADTRGAVLAGVLMTLVLGTFWYFNLRKTSRIGTLAVALVVGAVAIGSVAGSPRVSSMAETVIDVAVRGSADESTNNRLEFYRAGVQSFLEAPLVGHGWARRYTAAQKYMPPKLQLAGYQHLHSDPMDLASAAGILGLLAYALMIATPLISGLRQPAGGEERLVSLYWGATLTAGFVVAGLTDSLFSSESTKMAFVSLTAVIAAMALSSRARNGNHPMAPPEVSDAST